MQLIDPGKSRSGRGYTVHMINLKSRLCISLRSNLGWNPSFGNSLHAFWIEHIHSLSHVDKVHLVRLASLLFILMKFYLICRQTHKRAIQLKRYNMISNLERKYIYKIKIRRESHKVYYRSWRQNALFLWFLKLILQHDPLQLLPSSWALIQPWRKQFVLRWKCGREESCLAFHHCA